MSVEFILLVGLPGSGKSTYGLQLRTQMLIDSIDTTMLSSDGIRKELYGDDAIQGNPKEVFNLMRERTINALAAGTSVIYDATNLTRKSRASILQSIQENINKGKISNNLTKKCHIIWNTIENCVYLDGQRDGTVGEEVILNMVRGFQTPTMEEGFDDIKIMQQGAYELPLLMAALSKVSHHDRHHGNSTVLDHSLAIIRLIGIMPILSMAKLVALAVVHDLGKIWTQSFDEEKQVTHFYGHENVSAYVILGLSTLDMFDTSTSKLHMSFLANNHMQPFNQSKWFKRNADAVTKSLLTKFTEFEQMAMEWERKHFPYYETKND